MTLSLYILRTIIRMACTGRVYGFVFSLGAPLRAIYGNLLNSAATVQAVLQYAVARIRREPLKWLKTDHAYPTRAALLEHKRRLGEILVGLGCLTAEALEEALATMPHDSRLGEHLVARGVLTEDEIYDGLSFQQGLPRVSIDIDTIDVSVSRALPERAARQWAVLPFRVAEATLFVAGPEPPPAEMADALKNFTALEVRFHLVTPTEYRALADALL